VFSGLFTFLIIWLTHGLIFRWPPTRFSDRAVERALERLVLPLQGAVMGRMPRLSALRRPAPPAEPSARPANAGQSANAAGEGA
jgi:lipid A 4'-phosphatase